MMGVIFHAQQCANDIVLPCVMFVYRVYCFNAEIQKAIFFMLLPAHRFTC